MHLPLISWFLIILNLMEYIGRQKASRGRSKCRVCFLVWNFYFVLIYVVVVLVCVEHLLPSMAFTWGLLVSPASATRGNSPSSLHPMPPIGDNHWVLGANLQNLDSIFNLLSSFVSFFLWNLVKTKLLILVCILIKFKHHLIITIAIPS